MIVRAALSMILVGFILGNLFAINFAAAKLDEVCEHFFLSWAMVRDGYKE